MVFIAYATTMVEIFTFQAKKVKRQEIFKRAESYAKEYTRAEKTLIKNKRDARRAGNFFVDAQPKLAFVMRLRGLVLKVIFE